MPTDEQEVLLDTVRKFLATEITSEYLHTRLDSPTVSDPVLWKKLVELGFFEYYAEADEADLSLLVLLSVECGRALLPEALCESLLSGPILLTHLINEQEKKALVATLGEETFTAVKNGAKRIAALPVSHAISEQLVCNKKDVSGDAYGVVGSDSVAALLGIVDDQLKLFAPLPELKDKKRESSSALDRLLPHTTLSLSQVPLTAVTSLDGEFWKSLMRLVVAGELYGIADKVVSMTTAYVGERKQFGKEIGSFQAVQHKLVDAYHKTEELGALLQYAQQALDAKDSQLEVLSLVALSKAVGQVPSVIEATIQLHGGIGFTWEYDLHLYLRRAKTYEALYRLSSEEEEQMISSCQQL